MDIKDANARFSLLEDAVAKIQISQTKIEHALLGDLDKGSVGLIEEARTARREINDLRQIYSSLAPQVKESIDFKNNLKLMVAGIAVVVPFAFDLIKIGFTHVWDAIGRGGK